MAFQNAIQGETIKCLVLGELSKFENILIPCFSRQTWSLLLYACIVFAVCAFPYILAFTTDSIEIRLVVNGNLVYTAVVPELQLSASRVSVIDS